MIVSSEFAVNEAPSEAEMAANIKFGLGLSVIVKADVVVASKSIPPSAKSLDNALGYKI